MSKTKMFIEDLTEEIKNNYPVIIIIIAYGICIYSMI